MTQLRSIAPRYIQLQKSINNKIELINGSASAIITLKDCKRFLKNAGVRVELYRNVLEKRYEFYILNKHNYLIAWGIYKTNNINRSEVLAEIVNLYIEKYSI
jgi:hypothetical protein